MAVSHMNDGIRPHAISLPISLDFILLYGSVRICFWNHPQKHKNPQKPDRRAPAGFSIFIFSSHHKHGVWKKRAVQGHSLYTALLYIYNGRPFLASQYERYKMEMFSIFDRAPNNILPMLIMYKQ